MLLHAHHSTTARIAQCLALLGSVTIFILLLRNWHHSPSRSFAAAVADYKNATLHGEPTPVSSSIPSSHSIASSVLKKILHPHFRHPASSIPPPSPADTQPTGARILSPKELMARPLPNDRTRVPRLLHQSWMDNTSIPAPMQAWASTCRGLNDGWEYVLWTDDDNREMVKRFAGWFEDTYTDLKAEIYRADSARNVYMAVFGGVYVDLDFECLRPYEELFARYNISTAPYEDLSSPLPPPPLVSRHDDSSAEGNNSTVNGTQPLPTAVPQRKAFLGRMGTDHTSTQSIPNAWMASTPGHPFWLLPLQKTQHNLPRGGWPESLTGPDALWWTVEEYKARFHDKAKPASLDEFYAASPWGELYPTKEKETLEILPFWMIYPFSWQRDGNCFRDICLASKEEGAFNATKCKEVLGVEGWGSWSLTYWGHSWNYDGKKSALLESGEVVGDAEGEAGVSKGEKEEVKGQDKDNDRASKEDSSTTESEPFQELEVKSSDDGADEEVVESTEINGENGKAKPDNSGGNVNEDTGEAAKDAAG